MYEPCQCKGTIAYSHISCIKNWVATSGQVRCGLCRSVFKNVVVDNNYIGLVVGIGILYTLNSICQCLPFPLCLGFASSGIQTYRKVKVPYRDYGSFMLTVFLFWLNSWDISLVNTIAFFDIAFGGLGFLKFMLRLNSPCIRI